MNDQPTAGPSVSVVVPTYGRERVLVETIEAVLTQEPPPLEIIVVDQTAEHEAATEETLRRLADEKKIRWVREKVANLPRARNVGVALARGEVILFFDDDVVPAAGIIARHARHYADSALWGVGGREMLSAEEREMEFPLPIAPEEALTRWDVSIYRYTTPLPNTLRLGGMAFSVRRERYLELGGFNENFTGNALGEDLEFFWRARRRGAVFAYDPEAAVLHLREPAGGCRTGDRRWRFGYWVERADNWYYILFRHLGLLRTLAVVSVNSLRTLVRRAGLLLGRKPAAQSSPPADPNPGPVRTIMEGEGSRVGKLFRAFLHRAKVALADAAGLTQAFFRALRDRRVTGHYARTAAEVAAAGEKRS